MMGFLVAVSLIAAQPSRDIQVIIKQEHRIHNKDGSCVWCSLTTLCLHNGVPNGYKLYPSYKYGANPEMAVKALMSKKIAFYFQPKKTYQTHLIRWACKNGYGCAIGTDGHVLVLVHYEAEFVRVIDNSGKNALKVRKWSKEKFWREWNGLVYVVLPNVIYGPKSKLNPKLKPLPSPKKGR